MDYQTLEIWTRNELARLLPKHFNFYKGPGALGARSNYEGGFQQILMATNQYQPNYYIRKVSALIRFDNVEDTITGVLKRNKVNITGIGETIHVSLHNVEGIDYIFSNTSINGEESFATVFYEVEKIINYGAMPFFEQYGMLDRVADKLADMPPKEILNFIFGPILFIKTIAILRLTNHKRYNERNNEFLEILKRKAAEDKSYIPYLKSFEEFSEISI